MWVHGKIFNVHVLVKIVCVLSFFLGIEKNYLHTQYAYTSMLANEWSMI